jgi:hypothetical protein
MEDASVGQGGDAALPYAYIFSIDLRLCHYEGLARSNL